MNRAVLILPYYGKLPKCFGFYLKSVERLHFDVLLVTDIDVGTVPKNVHRFEMSFDKLVCLISARLGVEAKIDEPYRLCNFRPMYGRIFGEYIAKYEYWGFGDCDLVYGSMMNAELDKALNGGHDVISFRKHWLSGPTCFVRNCEKNNNLYLRARNWRDVAMMNEDGNPLYFDEVGGHYHFQLRDGLMTIADCEKIRDSFCAVVLRSPDVDYYHEDVLCEDKLHWTCVHGLSDGRLFVGKKEIAGFHFVLNKGRRFFTYVNMPYDQAGEFWIDDTGFYVKSGGRCFINLWRKSYAFLTSLRENGLRCWVRNIWRLVRS